MKNKSLLLWFGLFGVMAICFWWSFASATKFVLNVEKIDSIWAAISRSINPVHFKDNWNDFGGFIYFSNGTWGTESINPEEIYEVEISGNSEKKECKSKVRWFYYNAERWDRLWPLDENTWSDVDGMNWLVTEWWIYTLCRDAWYADELAACENISATQTEEGEEITDWSDTSSAVSDCVSDVDARYPQDHAYYGMVKHTLPSQYWWDSFVLAAWVEYQFGDQWIEVKSNSELAPNFVRFQNRIPVWFIYDGNWWVWFVGCHIDTDWTSALKYMLNASNQVWVDEFFIPDWTDSIAYNYGGDIWLNCSNIWSAADSLIKILVEWLVWMNRESDLGVIWNQTNSKMQYFSSSDINNATMMNYAKQRSEILCRWKWNNYKNWDTIICISGRDVDASSYKSSSSSKKTLVVKNWNVTITPASSEYDTSYYDIFVNNGDLIINESSDNRFVFTKQWFIQTWMSVTWFVDVISWAVNNWFDYTWDYVAVWSLIRWNFVVDGHVQAANGDSLLNKYFIYWKFTTQDSFQQLEEVFAWRCNNWYATDDAKYCPPSLKWWAWTNPYENASLVVIDQNYDSYLFW